MGIPNGTVVSAMPRRTSFDSSSETDRRTVAAPRQVAFPHEDRRTLERWIRMPTAPQRLVLRSRIDGCPAREIARRLGVSRPTVALWRRRYAEEGCDALTRDRPGRGRKRLPKSKDSF
jgi:DNA-directed RNA polymerase specialized sigma24 family protein